MTIHCKTLEKEQAYIKQLFSDNKTIYQDLSLEEKNQVINIISSNAINYTTLPESFKLENDVIKALLPSDYAIYLLTSSHEETQKQIKAKSQETLYEFFNINPILIDFIDFPENFFYSKIVAKKILNVKPFAFSKYTGLQSFQNDKEVMEILVNRQPHFIQIIGDQLKNDKEFLIQFFKKYEGAVGLNKNIPLLEGFENDYSESIETFLNRKAKKLKP